MGGEEVMSALITPLITAHKPAGRRGGPPSATGSTGFGAVGVDLGLDLLDGHRCQRIGGESFARVLEAFPHVVLDGLDDVATRG